MLRFVGFVANVDESILPIGKIGGAKIEKWSLDEATDLVVQTLRFPRHETRLLLFMELRVAPMSEGPNPPVIVLTRSAPGKNPARYQDFWKGSEMDFITRTTNPLHAAFERMRIFADGNVRMPLALFYYDRATGPTLFSNSRTFNQIVPIPFRLSVQDCKDLQTYLSAVREPLAAPYLRRAFDFLELAYQTPRRELAFLALMVGIETLFGANEETQRGTRSRIGTRLARLLGSSKGERKSIRARFEKLYEKRVGYVHYGLLGDILDPDVADARGFLRRSIKRASDLGLSPDDIRRGHKIPSAAGNATKVD